MQKYKDMTKDERREYIDAILKSHIQDTTWSINRTYMYKEFYSCPRFLDPI